MDDLNNLKLQLKTGDFSRSYAVLYTFRKGEDEQTVKFDLEVTYVKTIVHRSRLFRLDRSSEVFVDNIPPDLVADQLAYECGKVFYPLVLEIDFDGKFLNVFNGQEIIDRWQARRVDIEEYFKGEFTEKYLDLMDKSISIPEQVSEIFRNDLFCSVFFSNFYKSYGQEYKVEELMTFPLAGYAAPVAFMTTQEVQKTLNEAKQIELIHTGKTADERSAADLLEEQSFPMEQLNNPEVLPIEGSYSGRYIFEAETRSIRSIVASWTLDYEQPQSTEVKIFELLKGEEEEIEYLAETVESDNKGLFFLDGQHAPQEKKITNIFKFLWEK